MLTSGGEGAPTSAAAGLKAVADGRALGLDDDAILAHHPVALSLLPPSMGTRPPLPAVTAAGLVAAPRGEGDELSELREELRLRARWFQELSAGVAQELGARLARRDLLPRPDAVRWLSGEELEAAVGDGRVPDDVGARSAEPSAAPLPAAFRLTTEGLPVAVQGTSAGGGQGAGGGRAQGRVHQGADPVTPGDVLVVRTLDPGLAAVLPGLGGLVAETGSVLSHLAILARELGVPTVVGVADALARFQPGSTVVVDGVTGEVSPVEAAAVAS
jgi:pyruvate,water dikinase